MERPVGGYAKGSVEAACFRVRYADARQVARLAAQARDVADALVGMEELGMPMIIAGRPLDHGFPFMADQDPISRRAFRAAVRIALKEVR
jgi:hypothetical protein